MKRRDFLKASFAASLATAVGGRKAQGKAGERPNVLWIMMDDCRPDALGCYGRPWARTPNMDELARRGVRFDTAVTQCPICIPSRTSMKTGQYCHQVRRTFMGDPPADTPPYLAGSSREYPNLLTAWTDAGMHPINVGKRHAFVQDWLHKGDPRARKSERRDSGKRYPPVKLTTHGWQIGGTVDMHPDDTRPAQIAELALETLEGLADAGAPFFLRVSFHAPHVPIQVPPSFMVDPDSVALPLPSEDELKAKPRFEREQLRVYSGTLDLSHEALQVARGAYYGMVSLVDRQLGRILAFMHEQKLLDNTLIALNSDQGLQLGEHGLHKKRNFYEQTICSPLLFCWPDHLPEGKVVSDPVEMVDFVPTLMELSGLVPLRDVAGKSLVPLMKGEVDAWRPAVFAEIDHSGSMYDELRRGSGRRVMVRTREWKLEYFKDPRVADRDGALYNLRTDPQERFNVYDDPEYRDVIARLEDSVDEWDQVPESSTA